MRLPILFAFMVSLLLVAPAAHADREADFKQGMGLYDQRNYVGAYTPLVKAAKAGHAKAAFNIGVMFETKKIEVKTDSQPDYDQAVYWYDQAARKGHAKGQYRIGLFYMKGRGIAQNKQSALYWFNQSAAQNYQPAIAIKAFLDGGGRGQPPHVPDPEVERAAQQQAQKPQQKSGGQKSSFELMMEAQNTAAAARQREREDKKWVARHADQDALPGPTDRVKGKAAYDLAEQYWQGKGVQKDRKYAQQKFLEAIRHNYVDAMYRYAVLTMNGVFGPKDDARAAVYHHMAATRGHALAMGELGLLYTWGKGVGPANAGYALYWLDRAVRAGAEDYRKYADEKRKYGAKAQTPPPFTFADLNDDGAHHAEQKRQPPKQQKAPKQQDSFFDDYDDGYDDSDDIADGIGGMSQMYDRMNERSQQKAEPPKKDQPKKDLPGVAHLVIGKSLLQEASFTFDVDKAKNMYAEAKDHFEKAYAKGEIEAAFHLGNMYGHQDYGMVDHPKSFNWHYKAAEGGYPNSQYTLGAYYENGIGTDADWERALYWYTKAQKSGYYKADEALEKLNAKKSGQFSEQDKKLAKNHYDLGTGMFKLGDTETGLKHLKIASDYGHAEAALQLAILYEKGEHVAKDHKKALRYYTLAADRGDVRGQYILGLKYQVGHGAVPMNRQKAIHYLRLAAQQGDEDAKSELRDMGQSW